MPTWRLFKQTSFIQLLQYIEDRAYRRSNHLISNLKYLDKHIQSRGFSTDNFHWIPNGYSQTEVNKKVPLSADVKTITSRKIYHWVYWYSWGS